MENNNPHPPQTVSVTDIVAFAKHQPEYQNALPVVSMLGQLGHPEAAREVEQHYMELRRHQALYYNCTFMESRPTPLRPSVPTHEMPAELLTDEAQRLADKFRAAGMLDEALQAKGLTNTEKALLADCLAERLGIPNRWKCFATLWDMQPETLRSAYNKALEQNKSLLFQDRLKSIIC